MASESVWKAKIAAGRVPCETPFCRRTAKPGDYRIICGKCMMKLPRPMRLRLRKLYRMSNAAQDDTPRNRRIWDLHSRQWDIAVAWLRRNPQ